MCFIIGVRLLFLRRSAPSYRSGVLEELLLGCTASKEQSSRHGLGSLGPRRMVSAGMVAQEAILHASLNSFGVDALGLVRAPIWERAKGLMYRVESMISDEIANVGVNWQHSPLSNVPTAGTNGRWHTPSDSVFHSGAFRTTFGAKSLLSRTSG